jgi:hypothetical protein
MCNGFICCKLTLLSTLLSQGGNISPSSIWHLENIATNKFYGGCWLYFLLKRMVRADE